MTAAAVGVREYKGEQTMETKTSAAMWGIILTAAVANWDSYDKDAATTPQPSR